MTFEQFSKLRLGRGSKWRLRVTEDTTAPDGSVSLRAGTEVLAERKVAGKKIMVRTPRCSICGVGVRLSIHYDVLELIQDALERPSASLRRPEGDFVRYSAFTGLVSEHKIGRRFARMGQRLPRESILLGHGTENLDLIVEYYRGLCGQFVYCRLPREQRPREQLGFIAKLQEIADDKPKTATFVCGEQVVYLSLGMIVELCAAFRKPTSHFTRPGVEFLFDQRPSSQQ